MPGQSASHNAMTMSQSAVSVTTSRERPDRESNKSEGRRTKIWNLPDALHCSIIGTCLTSGELRSLLRKFNFLPGGTITDHDIHVAAIHAAGQPSVLAKQINKILDLRHRTIIHQFSRAVDSNQLQALWQGAIERGNIPGAYWAVLTHPLCSNVLMWHAFGHVHMLSHQIGAANRIDIRRLRQLEEEKADLEGKVIRQQKRLHEAIVSRDARIRELRDLVAERIDRDHRSASADQGQEAAILDKLVSELRTQLGIETRRRERAEERAAKALARRAQDSRIKKSLELEIAALRSAPSIADQSPARKPADEANGAAADLDLTGRTILYVGGRRHYVPHLRALVEGASGEFLYHDGGLEEHCSLLTGLLGRADIAFVPIDWVSHAAARTVKELCHQNEKPFVVLHSCSAASLLRALGSAMSEKRTPPSPGLERAR